MEQGEIFTQLFLAGFQAGQKIKQLRYLEKPVYQVPTLLPGKSWWEIEEATKEQVVKIVFTNRYISQGSNSVIWFADNERKGEIICYLDNANDIGTEKKLTIVSQFGLKANQDSSYLFGAELDINLNLITTPFSNLREIIGIEMLDTSEVENASHMFCACSSLSSLDLSSFNTSKLTNMGYMFCKCSSLASLDVSGFNTENVTNMDRTFRYCKFEELDLTNFSTAKVSVMRETFGDCEKLTNLYLNQTLFDMNNAWTVAGMFQKCAKLKSISAKKDNGTTECFKFQVNRASRLQDMFNGCQILTEIKIEKIANNPYYKDDGYGLNMSRTFRDCQNLTTLELDNKETKHLRVVYQMFYNCFKLQQVNLSNFNTELVNDMNRMFFDCKALSQESFETISFDTSNVKSMERMFYRCKGMTIPTFNFDTKKVTTFLKMFESCSGLTSIDITSFSASSSNVNVERMFRDCPSLGEVRVSNENWVDNSYMYNSYIFELSDYAYITRV